MRANRLYSRIRGIQFFDCPDQGALESTMSIIGAVADIVRPTTFLPVAPDSDELTGERLEELLLTLNPARPSHRRYAESILDQLTTVIAASREARRLGSVRAVQRAVPQTLSPWLRDMLLDYVLVQQFLNH